jgi:hypothetical protein
VLLFELSRHASCGHSRDWTLKEVRSWTACSHSPLLRGTEGEIQHRSRGWAGLDLKAVAHAWALRRAPLEARLVGLRPPAIVPRRLHIPPQGRGPELVGHPTRLLHTRGCPNRVLGMREPNCSRPPGPGAPPPLANSPTWVRLLPRAPTLRPRGGASRVAPRVEADPRNGRIAPNAGGSRRSRSERGPRRGLRSFRGSGVSRFLRPFERNSEPCPNLTDDLPNALRGKSHPLRHLGVALPRRTVDRKKDLPGALGANATIPS